MARGTLRIYLGAAPGVGKTVAMLDEGHRRLERGTDVVIAFAETHGRAYTAHRLEALPAVPRHPVSYRGASFEELDLAAVLARAPAVALVDELAHTNVPGSGPNAKRWQDVDALLEAGIDVISTLNIQHLESLNDVVQQITGVPQQETVPDGVVRAADQLELVDMSPEALRRRMAHGNVYPPERVDAALGNYFRVGNLTALRELALLWLADSVEEGLQRYRVEHGITGTWETKERIVVALTGGPEGDTLIRRAARIVSRTVGGELLAVHVARSDGLSGPGVAALTGQRLLVESLGGSYHSIVGDAVAPTLLDFARRVDATQIVLGASRRHWLAAALTGPGTGATVTRLSGPIDVHLVTHDYTAAAGQRLPRLTGGLTTGRRIAGLGLAAVLLPTLTVIGTALRGDLDFAADVPLYLLAVVITSLVGGFYPALLSALAASLLLNYYFVEPTHTFTISEPSNLVAVVIFLLIALLVSQVVDLAARRSVLAARAGAEAETLSTFAGSLLRGEQALPALLDRVRETFAMDAAWLRRHDPQTRTWTTLAAAGATTSMPEEADASVPVADDLQLALAGHPLPAGDQRVLSAFAAHVAVAYRQQQLAEAARAAEPLAESDRQRTALLNAVSHDLRTPIAAAKAAVSSLSASEVPWSEHDRKVLLRTAEDALDRLTGLVTNLLDLSRLQVGALPVFPSLVGVDDIVARALDHVDPDAKVEVDVPADLPEVVADAGLLERVVANVVQNALRYAPSDTVVRVAGSTHQGRVELRVIDRGPGIDAAQAEAIFRPFQRTDDVVANGAGVGLGLAIARGFTEAMGGSVSAEPTPGGGATVVIQPVGWSAPMTRILIVEDERPLLRALAMNLVARGYAVTEAETGTRALTALADEKHDAIVLDLGLPDMSGVDVIRAVRQFASTPIIVLSARSGSSDKVEALDLGADDYVTKPFSMDELLARLRSTSRRVTTADEPLRATVGDVDIDLAMTTATGPDGAAIHLTPTEWKILDVLLRRPGKLVSGDSLLTAVRGSSEHTDPSYLRIYLAQLRRKLEPEPSRPRYLITEPGMGYRYRP